MTASKKWIKIAAFPILLFAAYSAYAETITLSTYYPSPYGSYVNLETTGDTSLATAGGNVGIGTSTPANKLTVRQGTANNVPFVVEKTAGGSVAAVEVAGGFGIFKAFDAAGATQAQISGGGNSFLNGGNLGIGTATPAERLSVTGDIAATGNIRSSGDMTTSGNIGIGTATPAQRLDVIGSIAATGNITAGGTVTAVSDARFKTDIRPMGPVLPKLDALNPVTYERSALGKTLAADAPKREMGVIGQELEEIFPELVLRTGPEQYRSVDYGRLSVVLLEALKELRAEHEELKQTQTNSDAKIRELEKKLRQIQKS